MWNTGLFHAMGKNAQIDVEVAGASLRAGPTGTWARVFVIRRPGAFWR